MKIGIDASRAFLKNRTGIEEYSYQVIKNLKDELDDCQVVLYLRNGQKERMKDEDFAIPENWNVKEVKFPRFWTQVGLSLEMFLHPVDVLFIPAHTVPLIHPKKTVVTIHGLEYEFVPEAYSFWERMYMRYSIKNSCRWASEIISVSENTKKDLKELYGVSESKVDVVYEGYYNKIKNQISKNENENILNKFGLIENRYLLFIGRVEERKNIAGIVKAFEILKKEKGISDKLVLAGRGGFGYERILKIINESEFKNDIVLTGFVSEEIKWELLEKAKLFLFPTFYEGFGIPILEAQSAGVPVIASDNSSIPEVSGGSAVLIAPENVKEMAEEIWKIISDENKKEEIIKKGFENIKRFSWQKCAKEIAEILK